MDTLGKWWVWLLFVLAIGSQIVGAVWNLKWPLFWIGRQVRAGLLKHKGAWPIRIEGTERQPTAVFSVSSRTYEVEVEARISLENRSSRSKIDSVALRLTSEGYEDYKREEAGGLTNKKLSSLADGKYTLRFMFYLDSYLGRWYRSENPPNVSVSLEIETEGRLCKCDLGVISGKKICMALPSDSLPWLQALTDGS